MESRRKSPVPNSQKHRNTPAEAEHKLWQHLRHKQLLGAQFSRHKPVSHFIVDFYCAKARLVIEINSNQYFDTAHLLKDSIRDQALRDRGLHVLRFNNQQVLLNMDAVVGVIYSQLVSELKTKAQPPQQ